MSDSIGIEEIENLASKKNWELVNKENEWDRDYVSKNGKIKIMIDSPVEISEGPLNNIFIESEMVQKDPSLAEEYYNNDYYRVTDSEGLWKNFHNKSVSNEKVIEVIEEEADYIHIISKVCICSQQSTIEEVEETFDRVANKFEEISN